MKRKFEIDDIIVCVSLTISLTYILLDLFKN
jgi:hypothetical protein